MMKTVYFSEGLLPFDVVVKFIEGYFEQKGIKVFAMPKEEIFALEGDDDIAAFLEDCHDQLVMFLIESDFPAQGTAKKPEVKPEDIFAPRKSNLVLPNEQDLQRDWSKPTLGHQVLLDKAEGKKKHYKMK
jgi:hypothetical protein